MCLSVCLSIYLSFYLPIYLSIWLCMKRKSKRNSKMFNFSINLVCVCLYNILLNFTSLYFIFISVLFIAIRRVYMNNESKKIMYTNDYYFFLYLYNFRLSHITLDNPGNILREKCIDKSR